jgi:hypothetical protein
LGTVVALPPADVALVLCLQVGEMRFYTDLFMVGLLYHLYNQVRLCTQGAASA